MVNDSDFEMAAKRLSEIEEYHKVERVFIRLNNARSILERGLKFETDGAAVWLPEYDNVVDWLQDNKGRGLLMYGNCGRGKTVLGGRVIPMILNRWFNKVVSCYTSIEMNKKPDIVLAKKIVYIDDVGIEDVAVSYGSKRLIFPELVDAAEQHGKLLIISTNLSLPDIVAKYGVRTVDRLKTLTTQIRFVGESMRR